MTTEEWNDKQTGSNDGRADLSSPLGAVAMRDAAIAEIDCGGCYGECVDPANCRIEDVAAIRAIPLPTHADMLAAALKLPEVAAMVEAVKHEKITRANFIATPTDDGTGSCMKWTEAKIAWMDARDERDATLAALEAKP